MDLITFVKDLAEDTKAAIARRADPLEAAVRSLQRQVDVLRVQLAEVRDGRVEQDDEIGIGQADGWRQ